MKNSLVKKAEIIQWANTTFREHLKDKFEDLKDLDTPYGTFGELVFHVSGAIYFWFSRFGIFDFTIKKMDDLTSTEEFFTQWEFIDEKFCEYLKSIDESESSKKLSFTTSKGSLFEIALENIVLQLYSHSYYHRGHIAYFCRLNNIKLPQTDALVYLRTKN